MRSEVGSRCQWIFDRGVFLFQKPTDGGTLSVNLPAQSAGGGMVIPFVERENGDDP